MDKFIERAKAVADPTRVRILKVLEAGELCACEIEETVGIRKSMATRHLGVLKAAGLVEAHLKGQWTHYRLAGRGDGREFVAFVMDHLDADQRIQDDWARLMKVRGTCEGC
jgi:DNA-binding transcriptional ArsR family regulator